MYKKMLLRIGLITGLAAAFYPVPVLLASWDHQSVWLAAELTGFLALAAWLGLLMMLVLFRRYQKRPRRIQSSFFVGAVLLLLVSVLWAPFSTTGLRILYGILLGGCYYGGSRLILQPLERLSHTYVLTGICILDVVLGLVCRFCDKEASVMPVVWILIGNTLLFVLAHNLHALEQMLSGGREHVKEVPQEIRQSNFRIMTIFCMLGASILLICLPLTRVLRWLGRWIYTGVWYLLRWLLTSDSDMTDNEMVPDTVEKQMTTIQQNAAADWIWLAVELAIGFGMLVLVIWKRWEIWEAIQRLWQNLRHWAASKLAKKPKMMPDETGAYCDYVEDLLIQENVYTAQADIMTNRRWNRVYRRYLRMPLDERRYRLGYALALECLPEEAVHASDSTGEILENLQKLGLAEPYWMEVTQHYNAVRYGEVAPKADDFAALDAILRQMKG